MYKQIITIAAIEASFILLIIFSLSTRPLSVWESSVLNTHLYRESLAIDIRNAEKFVYGTTYLAEAYTDNVIINELESAKKRGVEVRLMFDHHSFAAYPTIRQDLEERDISYKVISGHAKVVVIDNKTAYVGSSNWNRNGLEANWELNLKTNTASTISEAYHFVALLWESGRKPVVYADTSPERFVNGAESYNLLIEKLQLAESVKLLTYVTSYNYSDPDATDFKIFSELKKAHDRGAKLQIVMDDSEYFARSSAREFLVENSIPHKLDEMGTEEQILHAKAVLIDDKVLFIGSHNWDIDSLRSSQQVSIMTTDNQVISDFLIIFEEKWQSSSLVSSNSI
jgi:phosphatidylserine/phosphatidylglycerophosphate/cardiolipin synthase-like enzyme